MGYSIKLEEETTARAYGKELFISPKKSREVCGVLRGKMLSDAKELLEEVIAMKRAIPYRRYKKCVAHKRGMAAGGYPIKVARALLRVLKNAEENAAYKGLDSESMKIVHISAYKGSPVKGYMPRAYGRSTQWNKETTNVEVILKEVE